ncbi:hypothetical protein R20943_03155 [Paraburkholderia aspalathi]|nr:hypothetical protein R20943_03155 [Paraburkholderia aspalathi]
MNDHPGAAVRDTGRNPISGTPEAPGPAVWTEDRSPEERVLTHPLFGEPNIRTPPGVEAYHAGKRRMLDGIAGFCVLGDPGMGRRGVLKMMRGYLSQEFPRLAVIEHVLSRHALTTPSAVLSSLLVSAGHSVVGGSRIAQLQRLLNLQEEKALISGAPLSVVILHNAEYVNEVVCETLLDLHDGLRLHGIRPFTISGALLDPFVTRMSQLAGSLHVTELRSVFGSVHYLRFLEGIEDYTAVLAEIDTLLVGHPNPTTWTEALLPLAYRGGFRLTSQAPALHAGVVSQVPTGRFPVRDLFDVVRQVLAMAASLDSPEFEIPPDSWAEAVRIVMGIGIAYLPGVSSAGLG